MATFTNLENAHVFSKAVITPSMSASAAGNTSTHTIQSKDTWAEAVPFLEKSDLSGVSADKEFKIEGYGTVKFHYKKNVYCLINSNNNDIPSNGYVGKIIDSEGNTISQFISPTDVVNDAGQMATVYQPSLYDSKGESMPLSDYIINPSNGLIYDLKSTGNQGIFATSATDGRTEYKLSFFTYEGAKLDTTITNIKSSINETKDDLSSHASDTDVHITTSERSKWNTAASKAGTAIQTVKRTNNSSTLINVDQSETSVSITLSDTIATKDEIKEYIDNHTIYNGVNSNNWNIIQDGSSAFTTSLEDLPSSMPSLTVATGMFEGNTAITEFNIKVPNLVIADNMFSGCTNLTTIDSSFQNVVSATNMFENCPLTSIKLTQPGFANLTEAATYTDETTKEAGLFDSAKETLVTATVSMPSLINGTALFRDFTALESYTGDLNHLENGNMMFRGCSALTSFSGDLTSLTNGRWMFGNTALSAWDNDIPKLKNGYAMYYNVPIKYFNGSLAALEDGQYMFDGCSKLEDFSGDLTSLTNGYQMFARNGLINFTTTSLRNLQNGEGMFRAIEGQLSPLKTFTVRDKNMSKLTNAPWMFQGCGNLTEFDCELSSLETATAMFQKCESLKNIEIELPSLTVGGTMFAECTSFTEFNVELPRLEDGSSMFQNCTSLVTFTSDLSSMTNNTNMFSGCTSLQTVDCDFSSITNHRNMFSGCTSLRIVKTNMSSLENSDGMFQGFTTLTTFTIDAPLSSLTTAANMFNGCSALTTFDGNLPELLTANDMFKGCTSLTEVNGSYPKLTNGNGMFMGCTALTDVNCDFSSLTQISNMFNGCKALTTFNGTLSSLSNSSSMFNECSALTTFNSDLSELTEAFRMFYNCKALTSFTTDLPKLTNGTGMFFNSGLTTFDSDLSSLTNGGNMFSGCKLDKDSVLGIINCLKTTNTCANAANLVLGINASLRNDSDILTALGISEGATSASLTGHGGGTWTITLQWNS